MESPSSMGTSSVTTLNQYKKRARAEASTRLIIVLWKPQLFDNWLFGEGIGKEWLVCSRI